MKIRVTVKSVETYHKISFVFPTMEAASQFMGVTVQTAENEIEFEVEPVYLKPIPEETTKEGDEE